jgi:glycosyltransferase involved in cell wall biosynthesis
MRPTIKLSYVGSVVPDAAEYHNQAFSRAGNMFQENLLAGLSASGIVLSLVLSCRPMPAFPRSRRILVHARRALLSSGIPVSMIPFLNVSPLKQLMVGVWVLFRLLWWGWKNRDAATRIVYTFNLTVPPALFTMCAARLIGARVVASVNDINEPGATVPRTWIWRLDFVLHKALLPRFDALVAVSSAIIDDFAPKVRSVRVEGGITPEMADLCRDVGQREHDDFRVVFAGGMEAANGVEVMLQAISLLPGPRYRFVFAGGGPLAEVVQRAAAKDSRIEYRGLLKLSELLPIYRQADVLINMRLTKAMRTRYFFPSKLLEFLASGTPVISTCTGHVEEEFGKYLFLLRDETPGGVAEAIRVVDAAGADSRRRTGSAARAFMLVNKTWQAQAARVGALLETLVGEGCRS